MRATLVGFLSLLVFCVLWLDTEDNADADDNTDVKNNEEIDDGADFVDASADNFGDDKAEEVKKTKKGVLSDLTNT